MLERSDGHAALLTRKASLVDAATLLPRSVAQLRETAVVPGYIASLTTDAAFVRVFAGVTGAQT